jgi:transcriptional regulator with XRE-family HTH domain
MNTKIQYLGRVFGGYSQLAKEIGVSRQTIHAWANRKGTPSFNMDNFKRLEEMGYDWDFWEKDFHKISRTYVSKEDLTSKQLIQDFGFNSINPIEAHQLVNGSVIYTQEIE